MGVEGTCGRTDLHFYPRPPRGGRRRAVFCGLHRSSISIHALREEGDPDPADQAEQGLDFYPRPPRGGRHIKWSHTLGQADFYPRPPRGGRRLHQVPARHRVDFYPRPPRGGRRSLVVVGELECRISIHALREEGDSKQPARSPSSCNFYPRPPRGGRQQKQRQNLYFQTNYTTFCTNLEEP